MLLDTRERSIERFERRSDSPALPWHSSVAQVVADSGGSAHLSQMYDQLVAVVHARHTPVVSSIDGAVEETYRALVAVLDAGDPTDCRPLP